MIELHPEPVVGGTGVKMKTGVIAVAIGLTLIAGIAVVIVTDSNLPICLFFIPIGLILLIPFVLPYLRNRAARSKLDPISLKSSIDRPRVGDPLDIEMTAEVRTPVQVERTRIELVFREWVRYEQGTDTVTKSEEWVIQQSEQPGGNYQPGAYLAQSVRFVIPANAMHSFNANDNRCIWLLRLRIDVQGWADFNQDYLLTVLPQMREGE